MLDRSSPWSGWLLRFARWRSSFALCGSRGFRRAIGVPFFCTDPVLAREPRVAPRRLAIATVQVAPDDRALRPGRKCDRDRFTACHNWGDSLRVHFACTCFAAGALLRPSFSASGRRDLVKRAFAKTVRTTAIPSLEHSRHVACTSSAGRGQTHTHNRRRPKHLRRSRRRAEAT